MAMSSPIISETSCDDTTSSTNSSIDEHDHEEERDIDNEEQQWGEGEEDTSSIPRAVIVPNAAACTVRSVQQQRRPEPTDGYSADDEGAHEEETELETQIETTTQAVDQATRQFTRQFDPARMTITEEERQHALAIKRTIEATPDLDSLSDMMYAQLAIVGDGDLEWAVNRAYLMEEFKKDYRILDTLDDCLRHIPGLCKDRTLLSVDFNLQQGGYIAAYDGPKYDMTVFKSEERVRPMMQRIYYTHMLLCPDLAAVRAGITSLYECEGYVIGPDHFSLKSFRKAGFAASVYPNRHAQTKFFNTPTVVTFLLNMAKHSFQSELAASMKFACKSPWGRLDRFYNLPSPEAAAARLKVKLEELMRRRFHNEAQFSLLENNDSNTSDDEPPITEG